jgi:phytoene dehydrogenase-like protein
MTIPTSVDGSMAPTGCHVAHLFTQYTPYHLKIGGGWNATTKEQYARHGSNIILCRMLTLIAVFKSIDTYAPNFSANIVGYEVLPPPELERIFNLTGGVSENVYNYALSRVEHISWINESESTILESTNW